MILKGHSRRVLTSVGIVLVLIGVGIFGYFAWQYVGTNVVAKTKQDHIRSEIRHQWAANKPATDAVALLRIPRFGTEYEVPIIRGWSSSDLSKGVGMFDHGAQPGQLGNLVLAGHLVTHGQPFADFKKLRTGDKIIIETKDKTFVYELDHPGTAYTVNFQTSWPLQSIPSPEVPATKPADKPYITLVTCAEDFHTDMRLVTTGVLVKTETK